MQIDQLKMRGLIALLGGTAAWPLAAPARRPAMPMIGPSRRAASPWNDHSQAKDGDGMKVSPFACGEHRPRALTPRR
jgi:hypothetical protein